MGFGARSGMLQAAVLLASLPAACSNFFSSLHSNFVVSLDFGAERLGADTADVAKDPGAHDDTRLMTFAGGRRKFKCRLPSRQSSSRNSADLEKLKANFRGAKVLPLRGRCVTLHKPDDYWTYDVCFGRKVVQYKPTTDTRFSLGEYVHEIDELHDDGSVHELYAGGSDNRSTEIRYECGIYEHNAVRLSELKALSYLVRVPHPAFCPWRDREGAETRDQSGRLIKASAMLEALRTQCVNLTQGWWTFEYCFPHTLRQVHMNNGERETTHILGTINGTSEPTAPGEVNMKMVRLKPTIDASERRAPPSSHRTLQQRLGMGAVCDETSRPRAAVINFQCPPNWQSRPEPRIISVTEPSLCEYEVTVHTVLLCGHQRFVPALPKGKEEIACLAEELD